MTPDAKNSITVEQMSKSTPVLGILSIVFGGISLMPFLGIISPVGVIIGVIALTKRQKITGIIGTSVSVLGMVTSPFLWVIVICSVNPSSDACKPKVKTNIEQQHSGSSQPSAAESAPSQHAPTQAVPAEQMPIAPTEEQQIPPQPAYQQ